MVNKHANLQTAVLEIRLCFNQLRATADKLQNDLGINASMSAVMEHLSESTGRTVPDIARSRSVSRQHIQMIVNKLSAAKLVTSRANPTDMRTSLISLSARGQSICDEVQRRQALELGRLSESLSADELQNFVATIKKLNNSLKGMENE